MPVTFINAQKAVAFNAKQLRRASQLMLEYLELGGFGFGIKCAGDRAVRKLNRTYRQIDAPTDVLSFPHLNFRVPGLVPKRLLRDLDEPYLGDLVLGMPYISRQCQSAGIHLDDRLLVVVTHGLCHLIGHTHGRSSSERKMQEKEQAILNFVTTKLQSPSTLTPLSPLI